MLRTIDVGDKIRLRHVTLGEDAVAEVVKKHSGHNYQFAWQTKLPNGDLYTGVSLQSDIRGTKGLVPIVEITSADVIRMIDAACEAQMMTDAAVEARHRAKSIEALKQKIETSMSERRNDLAFTERYPASNTW